MAVQNDMESGKLQELEYKEIEWTIPNYYSKTKKAEDINWKSNIFFFNGNVFWLSLEFEPYADIALSLNLRRELNCEMVYSIRLKNCNNTKLPSGRGILLKGQTYESIYFTNQDLLWDKKIPSSDALTIICTLNFRTETAQYSEADLLDQRKTPKFIHLDKLSDNFKDLFGNKERYDTTLKVKDKDFKAHRLVLIARSSVFAAAFKHDSLESQTGIINIPDCDPDSFQEFLEYLYCGKLEEVSLDSALNLYCTSDKYDVQDLKKFCAEYLLQCLTIDNVCEIAVLADKYEELELYSAVTEFFLLNTFEILLTTKWDDLLKEDCHLANKLLKQISKEKVKNYA